MIHDRIDSPFTDGAAVLKRKVNSFMFRKSNYEIVEHYYECETTHNEFTTSEVDNLNLIQVYNRYRDKHGLPFPGQIRNIREKYGISARKMSEILGLGTNSYRLYEQGEVPSVGNGRLILAAGDPGEFQKFLIASEELIDTSEFAKINASVESLIDSEVNMDYSGILERKLFRKVVPDHKTGYRLPDLEKITHMVLYFSEKAQTFKTKLNTLLFYSDFLAFKHFGFGISGIDYRAIQMGPVPSDFDKIYELLSEGDALQREYVDYENGFYVDYFIPMSTFNETLFEVHELKIMDMVSEKFKNCKLNELIEISHQEPAWQENIDEKKIISYKDYAFTLQAL